MCTICVPVPTEVRRGHWIPQDIGVMNGNELPY